MVKQQPSDFAIEFASLVTDKFQAEVRHGHVSKVYVMAGKTYDRLVIQSWMPNITSDVSAQKFAYAFVERATGALLKTSSWAAPAKTKAPPKFNLSTPEGMAQAVEAADVYGSFLYARN